jgi:hypothetical protein
MAPTLPVLVYDTDPAAAAVTEAAASSQITDAPPTATAGSSASAPQRDIIAPVPTLPLPADQRPSRPPPKAASRRAPAKPHGAQSRKQPAPEPEAPDRLQELAALRQRMAFLSMLR